MNFFEFWRNICVCKSIRADRLEMKTGKSKCFVVFDKKMLEEKDEVDAHFVETKDHARLIYRIQLAEPQPCKFEWSWRRVDCHKQTLSNSSRASRIMIGHKIFFSQ
jgi:hypothetical protein